VPVDFTRFRSFALAAPTLGSGAIVAFSKNIISSSGRFSSGASAHLGLYIQLSARRSSPPCRSWSTWV